MGANGDQTGVRTDQCKPLKVVLGQKSDCEVFNRQEDCAFGETVRSKATD